MRWSNEMFYILLLNSFAGAIAYGFWIIAKKVWRRRKIEICVSNAWNCGSFFHFSGNFVYLKISTHVPGSHGSYYGALFLRTPFIYTVQCVIAGIWILGVIFNLGNYIKEYWKFKNILKKALHMSCLQMYAVKFRRNLK